MRSVKTYRQKERLLWVPLLEPLDGFVGKVPVYQSIVSTRGFGPWQALLLAPRNLDHTGAVGRVRTLVCKWSSIIPGFRVVHALQTRGHAEMKYLSTPRSGVPMGAEPARQSHDAWKVLIEIVLVIRHPGRARAQPGKE
jgi:hypothetical protein